MTSDRSLFGPWGLAIVFVFLLLGQEAAFAQSCAIDGPRYNLTADTVGWSMQAASGRTCVRGVRFNDMVIEGIKVISPPQSGKVALQGSGFTYTAKAGFNGQDSFSLAVIGSINRVPGSSTINVTVSVGPSAGPNTVPTRTVSTTPSDTAAPSVSITAPSNGAIVSGSLVTLSAEASDNVAVARVQFIVDGKNIGAAMTVPPYTIRWNSNETTDGPHTLYAVAQDTSGNYGTSSVRLTIENAHVK